MRHQSVSRPLRLTMLALSLACAGLQAHADPTSDRINQLERKLEQSLQKINELTARLLQLESKQAPVAAAPSTTPAAIAPEPSTARVEALEQRVAALSSAPSKTEEAPLLHGFASVGAVSTNRHGAKSGATIESLDFYLTPQLGNRVRALVELNTEVNEAGEIGIDLERLQLGYAFGDELTLWAGRFHTPYGYWNTAFHHGAQIQTSIARPKFLDFEDNGGILPAHSVGLWARGGLKPGAFRLDYDAWLTNSQSIGAGESSPSNPGTLNPNLHGTGNNNAVIGFKAGLSPDAWSGLTLGVHSYHARIGGPDAASGSPYAGRTLSNSTMLGGYATYQEDDWEILGEYYHFHNENTREGSDGLQYNSWAGYLQAGRSFGLWTPYLRLEKTSLNQLDEYFAAQLSGRSYRRSVAGLRYDLSPRASLKVEVNRTHQDTPEVPGDDAPGAYNETRLQFGVRF